MKSHQPPPRSRAAVSAATSSDEEVAPSNAEVQEQLKGGGRDWQDDLLAMVLAHGPAPATPVQAAPSPEEQARHDASVAAVWRMMLPNTAGRTDAELASIRAPVIDGPSLEEQAQWDREWAARPEFQNRASEAPATRGGRLGLDWLLGKKG